MLCDAYRIPDLLVSFLLNLFVIVGCTDINIMHGVNTRKNSQSAASKLVQVMLDKLALQLERRKLIADNRTLQNAMGKWLDNYTFTDKAKEKANSLMVSSPSISFESVALETSCVC